MKSFSQKNFLYIKQDELLNKIIHNENILLIDLREDDYIGGHIKNSVNIPANTFSNNIDRVLRLLDKYNYVIFYCQESLKRSPRCSNILLSEISDNKDKQIYILEGGFYNWVKRFWNTNLVEEYNDEYWYYENDAKMF